METQPEITQNISSLKLTLLKTGDYDLWSMRMEQYLTHTDYALWEVIINGDSSVPEPPAVGTVVPPKTEAQKLSRKNELKAKSILLLAIPDEHLLKFHSNKDAKSLWEAIKIRFGGNKESKKMHKTILKQQYENFVASRSDGLDKTYDRFKKLINQSELNGSNSHNVAFVSSENTSSINETITTVHYIPVVGSKEQPSASSFANDVMFSFFACQSNTPQLDNEDLEQIDTDELEEIDLKWNQGNKSADNERIVVPVETPASTLVVQDGLGGYDWSYQAEEGPTNFVLMAHSSDSTNSSNSELEKTMKEKDDLKEKLTKFEELSKNLTKVINSQMSANDKTGLGYDSQLSKNEMPICEIFETVFDSSVSGIDEDNNQEKDSVNHLIKDYTFYENKMVEESVVNNKGKCAGQKEVRPVWNNARRVNHQNFSKMTRRHPKRNFVPTVVATKSGQVLVNAAKQNSAASTSTARPKGHPQYTLQDYGIFNSGCSRHMTGNKSFLTEYQENDGGVVAFEGSPKEATIDESNLWHRRLGHINFNTLNKLVRGNHFCQMKGIKREFSIARTPQQNGVAKRKNRTLIEATMTMLKDFLLPTTFWAKAVNTASYVQNRVLVTKPHNKTPYELLIGNGPEWLFDINSLTKSMNYEPVSKGNQSNGVAGNVNAGDIQGDVNEISRNDDVCQGNEIRIDSSTHAVNAASTSINTASNNIVADFIVYQIDVKSAFLYRKIEEDVYVCQPPGFEDPDFPDKVYKVNKALYGLHQALRAWYETLSTSTKKEMCDAFEILMHEKFQMSSMGELTFFLGLQGTKKVNKDNDQEHIQVLVDKMKVIITEDSIRSNLRFDDAEGTACLLNEVIFEGLARKRHKEMYVISSHTKKIFANMRRIGAAYKNRSGGLRRLKKFGSVGRVKSPMEKDGLGSQEDASKQGRMIKEINQNAKIALDDETQGRTNDDEMFGVNDLATEEVVEETTTDIKDSAARTTDVTKDEIIMAQALAALKSVKPKVVQSQIPTVSSSKDKDKAKMIEPEVPLKKKDHMIFDEEYARKL
uniref:Integrase catalytic domain-containing protein n=1 Tax=Tanacetum cinerariifolium TaxID=118510 RepID=A0A6L2MRR9_TANCI|nr:hypothetical protein [Tanacetum cinerariifolium]